ncbi:MAG: TraR/DksA family transcriptional regulator [Syntrophales bacterium]|nr:TraR/DksA family transcriptional regulator [Syntrophales bacterium]
MINRKMMENVRCQLVLQIEYLQDAAYRTAVRIKDEPGNLADVVDQAAVEHDRSVELTIRGWESQRIREIRETILRIDRGLFGICARCGKAIAPKRLQLALMSRLCTSCKAKMELHQKHGGGCVPGNRISENYAA